MSVIISSSSTEKNKKNIKKQTLLGLSSLSFSFKNN